MGEVGVPDWLSGFKENLAPRQIYDFKVRLKPRKIFWLHSGEEPVSAVKGSLGAILHGKVSPCCADFQNRKSSISAGL
ncbi:hypothetical protein VB618_02350 [Microvirga sp. CF3062]|uniref:hypothetical protein n=1 Tax=Microvirga sp. CF3062 TaxID=3110182 RepID=UPI002E781CB5|nr:hypothetical protein [Microvirga sp. CF3062]MEE1655022.1 hypothetical protein [Microvirga sp. CF3062]